MTTLHLSWLVQDSLVLLPQGLEVTCDYPTVVYRHQQLGHAIIATRNSSNDSSGRERRHGESQPGVVRTSAAASGGPTASN